MKVLQLSNKVPIPINDGGSYAIMAFHRGFVKAGHESHILAMETYKHPVDAKILLKENISTSFVDTKIDIFKLIINFLFSFEPYIIRRFWSESFKETLIEKLTSEKYDIIQLEGLYLTPYLNTIREHSKALIAYRSHNIEHDLWLGLARNTKNIFRKVYFYSMFRRLKRYEVKQLRNVDCIVPISRDDYNKIISFTDTPQIVAPTGIDINNIRERTKAKPHHIGFIGSLDWIPNQNAILWFIKHVWPKIYNINKNLQLNIAGRNCPLHVIKEFTVDGVIFHGEVSDAQEFIQSNEIIVLPLFSSSGMRIRILEAMALGKAIITTDAGIKGMHANKNQHVIIANSKELFIEELKSLLENPDKREKIGENAYNWIIKNFNNENISLSVIHFYNSLIATNKNL